MKVRKSGIVHVPEIRGPIVNFSQSGQVHRPLIALGLDRKLIYNPSIKNNRRISRDFWVRNEHNLPELLNMAHSAYRKAMKTAHTDVNGGSYERAILLNRAWRRVKKLFKQHGIT